MTERRHGMAHRTAIRVLCTISIVLVQFSHVSCQASSSNGVFATQLAVTAMPFGTARQLQGGVSFNGTVAELKDAGFSTVPINDGRYITVSLDANGGDAVLETASGGLLELRFGVNAQDGTYNCMCTMFEADILPWFAFFFRNSLNCMRFATVLGVYACVYMYVL